MPAKTNELFGETVEFLASDIIAGALDVPIKALDKIGKKIFDGNNEHINKLFEALEGMQVLVIQQAFRSWKDSFSVFDSMENIKYNVKGKLTSIKHHTHVHDAAGVEVGSIKEKLIAVRSPFSLDSNPADSEIYIAGKKIGKLNHREHF